MKGIKAYITFRIIDNLSKIDPLFSWLESKFTKHEKWKAPAKLAIQSTVGTKPASFGAWGLESGIKVGILSKK